MEQLSRQLGVMHASVGNELTALWTEYDQDKSPEAMLMKQLDKFERMLQAYHYELGAVQFIGQTHD